MGGMATLGRTATLMVTHDVEEAVVLSDRILVMNMGPASIIRSYDVARIGLADRDTKPFFDVTTKIRKELSAELGFE